MRIRSAFSVTALYSAFLAAGTWVLPTGTISVAAATPHAVMAHAPAATDSNLWIGSEVEVAWRSATGQSADFEVTGIWLTNGSPDAPTQFSVVDLASAERVAGTEVAWIPLDGFEVDTASNSEQTPDGGEVSSSVVLRMVAGITVSGTGGMGYFVAALYSITGTVSDSGLSGPVMEQASVLLPIASFVSSDLALARLDRLASAVADSASGSGGGGLPGCGDGSMGIDCINPNWVGRNGEQCCALEACWKQKISHCDLTWDLCMLGCLLAGIGTSCAATFACLKNCKMLIVPLFIKNCILICIGVGVAGALITLVACAGICDNTYGICKGEANDWYFEKCFDTGCSQKPGVPVSAIEEILDEQQIRKGDGFSDAHSTEL